MKEDLVKVFLKYNIIINDTQAEQFCLYYNFLLQENEKFNLTAIVEEKDVIFKHFLDSCLSTSGIRQNSTLVDVGSGAGFPGIPIKIIRPDIEIVLVDSLQKRVNFLNQAINLLKLENINAKHVRVEDFAVKNREMFDYATSRAVAQVNTLSEYLLPLVKVGGNVIMYKSQKVEEELKNGENAIKILGGKLNSVKKFKIEELDAERILVFIDKVSPTPKQYPRGKNLPKTKPIK